MTKIPPECKFPWSAPFNQFTTPNNILALFPTIQQTMMSKTIKQIQSNSGMKKKPCWLLFVQLFFVALNGFSVGFILIHNSYSTIGGVFLIITSITTFYLVVGITMLAGKQTDRIQRYLYKNEIILSRRLNNVGLIMVSSFSMAELYTSPEERRQLKWYQKVKLCCKSKILMQGFIKFRTDLKSAKDEEDITENVSLVGEQEDNKAQYRMKATFEDSEAKGPPTQNLRNLKLNQIADIGMMKSIPGGENVKDIETGEQLRRNLSGDKLKLPGIIPKIKSKSHKNQKAPPTSSPPKIPNFKSSRLHHSKSKELRADHLRFNNNKDEPSFFESANITHQKLKSKEEIQEEELKESDNYFEDINQI